MKLSLIFMAENGTATRPFSSIGNLFNNSLSLFGLISTPTIFPSSFLTKRSTTSPIFSIFSFFTGRSKSFENDISLKPLHLTETHFKILLKFEYKLNNQVSLLSINWRVTALHLVPPIISTAAISMILALIHKFSSVEIEATPFSEAQLGATGAILNMILYISLAFVGGFALYILFRRAKINILKLIFSVFYFFTSLFTLLLLEDEILIILGIQAINIFIYILPAFLSASVITYISMFSKSERAKKITIIIFSSLMGFLLGISLPILTLTFTLIALSLYDIYSVKKGPIKNIMETIERNKNQFDKLTLSYASQNIEIGLGDLIFYTALNVRVVINYSIFSIFMTFLGIFIGLLLTCKLLEKEHMVPGLPLPSLLAIIFLFVSLLF